MGLYLDSRRLRRRGSALGKLGARHGGNKGNRLRAPVSQGLFQQVFPGVRRSRAGAGRLFAGLLLLAGSARAAEPLQPDRPALLSLQPGQTEQIALAIASARPFRLRVAERGIDVEAAVVVGELRRPLEDDDILRWGEHRLAVARSEPGMQLELRATRLGSPAGKVTLMLEPVDLADSAASRRFGLDLTASELALLYADSKGVLEARTARMAQSLCAGRREDGDERGFVRCVSLQERILGRQDQREPAIAALQIAIPVWHKLGDQRGEATALNNLAMHHFHNGDGRLAEPLLRRAQGVLDGVDDPLLLAVVQSNICLTGDLRDSIPAARDCNETALQLSLASGDGQRIATAYNNLGGTYLLLGDTQRAAELFEQSIAQRVSLHDAAGQGDALSNLALTHIARGRLSEALRGFERAEAAYRSGNNRAGQARLLQYRGYTHMMLGEPALAVDLLQQALELQRTARRRSATAATLARLAEAQLANAQPDAARASADEAVAIAQIDGDPSLLASSWLRAARVHRHSGNAAAALAAAREAFAVSAQLENTGRRDQARLELAQVEMLSDGSARALVLVEAALKSGRLTQLQRIEAQTLLAAALRAQGRRGPAEAAYRRAVAATEQAGSYVYDLDLRATFLANQRDAELGLLSLLMSETDAHGGFRRAAEALTLSASFRARSLRSRLDAMPAAGAALQSAPLREQQLAQLAALAVARWRMPDSEAGRERRREIDAQIRAAEEALRTSDPAPRAGSSGPAMPLAQLQRALPDDASLVVYRLLPEAGYAWVVQRDAMQAVRLAPQQQLADIVQRVRAGLTAAPEAAAAYDSPADLARACDLLWQPLADRISTRRVFIVSDTALDGLPFAALRCGDGAQRDYLVNRHELSQLPATWLLLRPPAPPLPQDYAALLVGDPIYSRDDPRLGRSAAAPARGGVVQRGDRGRLEGSGEEIRRVRARLGAGRSTLLDGVDANLAALQAADMEKFNILHFATHGTGDRSGASVSGLVLSLFDADGRDIDGFLSARRIGAGRVPAALVVLGACDTATGRAVEGEGTVGVAYAFLQAGARHVVATLWPIDDGLMPELMDRFYRDPGLAAARPGQALREAQLALLQQYPQASPALWAGVAVWGW